MLSIPTQSLHQVEVHSVVEICYTTVQKENRTYSFENKRLFGCYGVSADLWHRRFGHLGEQNMKKFVSSDLVKDMAVSKQEMTFCEPCVEVKAHQQPYPKQSNIRSANILDLIHSDVCGPFKLQSLGGKGLLGALHS